MADAAKGRELAVPGYERPSRQTQGHSASVCSLQSMTMISTPRT